MLLNLHQCDFSASRFWTNAESRCLGYEIIVLRPLKPVNLLSKNAVEAKSFVCFAIVFRPSATILYKIKLHFHFEKELCLFLALYTATKGLKTRLKGQYCFVVAFRDM